MGIFLAPAVFALWLFFVLGGVMIFIGGVAVYRNGGLYRFGALLMFLVAAALQFLWIIPSIPCGRATADGASRSDWRNSLFNSRKVGDTVTRRRKGR